MYQFIRKSTFLFFCCSGISAQTWNNNGPFGGYITALVIDSPDTNIVYAGTYGGGIFKSVNGAQSWEPTNNGFPVWDDFTIVGSPLPSWWSGDFYPVTSLRIHPQAPGHIYAGTAGGGIAQSYNGGETWAPTNGGLPDSAIVTDLWLHPDTTSILFCGLEYPNGGLYQSADGGHNWTLVPGVPSGKTYRLTTINHEPGNPSTLYTGVTSAGDSLFAWGLLRSGNGGQTWETVSDAYSFYNLQIDSDNPQKLWSVVHTGFLQWLLGHSTDGGSTWTFYPDMTNPWETVLGLYADTFWNLYIIHGNSMRKSMDHGRTWKTIAVDMPFYPLGVFLGTGPSTATNQLDQNTLFIGSEAGVYRSDDGGQTVRLQEQGMINTYINDVEVSPNNPAIVYAGGRQGMWKSIDGGESWRRLNTDQVNAIAVNPDHPDTVYWGGGDLGLIRSYDGGETGEKINAGRITALEIRPDSANILFAGTYPSTIYKSIDYGNTWNESFSTNPPIGSSFWIEDIAIDRVDTRVIYFGAGGNWEVHGLYKSTDSGATWKKVSDPGAVISIAMDPSNSNNIYIATGSADKKSTIYLSKDGGQTFQEVRTGITSTRMSKIFINPENPNHLLLGTMDQGLFSSTNGGMTWESVPGPYYLRINDIYFSPITGMIYLGTNGMGVWGGDRIVLGINEFDNTLVPESFYLYPAYPNPFNGSTVLTFNLPNAGNIEMTIFDLTGKVVKRFSEHTFSRGTHKVFWDGNSDEGGLVHSGVFFVRLKSGQATMTRKITLLK
ncbi:MAG: T9SS type A sorting domain-containing protein [Candidatus Marinimicrobia bacterium]|nr:T9SS type A sorting domain-containing protein [Candidatus Neomarinimicrobiota bacterium]MBL7009619.1 T9SS type A sorting domain-containing protein [Candidatus Neomarinimicrobiota bacterium]